jgi:hypothetical protein
MNPKLKEFRKELKELLAKYDACIGLSADSGSDWWGISSPRIAVSFDEKEFDLVESGIWINADDLK